MASSKYYGDTAKKRIWLKVLTEQVCRDGVTVSLTKSPRVGARQRVTIDNEAVVDFPIGLAMTEMLRIIEEMEAAFECATGETYSFNAARLAVHKARRDDDDNANYWTNFFAETANEIWRDDVRKLYAASMS